MIKTIQFLVLSSRYDLSPQFSWLFLVANGKSWDCQVGFGGGDNRLRLGCLVAAGIGQGVGLVPQLTRTNLVSPCGVRSLGFDQALKHANFDLQTTGDHRKVQLNELRDQAYENSLIYKEKTKRLHDSNIKDRVFNIGDRVFLFSSLLKIFSGKLKSHWSGPFTISRVYPYRTFGLCQPNGPNFKVNGHRLKHYFGEDVPKLVVPDLQTFPKDH
nr:reverse transcriptase domain-containing protein [Tanacetum cinerariifolium]